MDSWFVVLRGDEDSLVEARAMFGAPVAAIDPVAIFTFDTADPSTAAGSIVALAENVKSIAGGVSVQTDEPIAVVRERALALALAAPEGEVLFTASARARIEREVVLVKGRARGGWRLPVAAAALAPEWALRDKCRAQLAKFPAHPKLVARDRHVSLLAAAGSAAGLAIVRAVRGAGGGRVIEEAAARAGKVLLRLGRHGLRDDDAVRSTVERLPQCDWIVVDPVDASLAPAVQSLLEHVGSTRTVVVRVHEAGPLDAVVARDRCVEVGALRSYDAQRLVASLLGTAAPQSVVRRIAKQSRGLAALAVEGARLAVQSGGLVWNGKDGYRLRERRALRERERPDEVCAARIHDLPGVESRAMSVLAALYTDVSEIEALASLRGCLAGDPAAAIRNLSDWHYVTIENGHVHMSEGLVAHTTPARARVDRLAATGALDTATGAEDELLRGSSSKSADAFALAARSALLGGAIAAAVRFVAAARATHRPQSASVREALAVIASRIGPVLELTTVGEGSPTYRPAALDPETLDLLAARYSARDDEDSAANARALAEVIRGNSESALRISHDAPSGGSSRSHLIAAIAQGATGRVGESVRSALLALAGARRAADPAGEAAALALLGTLYKSLGRESESTALSERAHALPRAAVAPAS